MNTIKDLTEFIPIGRANAISMRDLAALLNVDTRTVRALVQRAREQGAPICTDFGNGGYYLPADMTEAEHYFRQQQARIKTARAALNGVTEFLQSFAVADEVT